MLSGYVAHWKVRVKQASYCDHFDGTTYSDQINR